MRPLRELAATVASLAIVGVLAHSGVGRFVLPVVGLVVVAVLVALPATQSVYPRTAAGPRTRIVGPAAQPVDAACVEYGSSTAVYRRYAREWAVLGVPVVLLDNGGNSVCDTHRD